MTNAKTMQHVRMAAQAAEEKKGEDIVALDVRGQSSLTDCFLFISGTSHVHIRAIEDSIREALKDSGATLARTDGQRGHLWRALDYGSFIIHVMDKKTREFYAMERLWERAKPVPFSTVRGAPGKAWGSSSAVLARGSKPRASGEPEARPLTPRPAKVSARAGLKRKSAKKSTKKPVKRASVSKIRRRK